MSTAKATTWIMLAVVFVVNTLTHFARWRQGTGLSRAKIRCKIRGQASALLSIVVDLLLQLNKT